MTLFALTDDTKMTLFGFVIASFLAAVTFIGTRLSDRNNATSTNFGVVGELGMELAAKMDEVAERERVKCDDKVRHLEELIESHSAHIRECEERLDRSDAERMTLRLLAEKNGLDTEHLV